MSDRLFPKSSRSSRFGWLLAVLTAVFLCVPAGAPVASVSTAPVELPSSAPRREALSALAAAAAARDAAERGPAFDRLASLERAPWSASAATGGPALMGVDRRGRPRVFSAHNLNAARTIDADHVWPGGSSGLDLDGANDQGEIALWDVGAVLVGHSEFGGRILQIDSAKSGSDHATHIAGTIIAAGADPMAKGIAYAARLDAYDWLGDSSEMATAAAAGLRVSNHSYGTLAGWHHDSEAGVWYWFGDPSVNGSADYGFGFYGETPREWDEIAWNAPGYLIVKSAGNDRDDTGPASGGAHYVFQGGTWQTSTAVREADGGPDGFDSIAWRGVAKNVLTVGAVEDLPYGYSGAGDVVMAPFSSWGPTDDGRIKPDLVAGGVGVWSPVAADASAYASYSGTSSAAAAASATAAIVSDQLATSRGTPPLAATVKGILVHTARESGPAPGPDYRFGWGLLDAEKAAELAAAADPEPGLVRESVLVSGAVDTVHLYVDGLDDLRVTLCWTDPPGPVPAPSLDPGDPTLVNDLELKVMRPAAGVGVQPWVLDPAAPDLPAYRGLNGRDNVERVDWPAPGAGEYLILLGAKQSDARMVGKTLRIINTAPDTHRTLPVRSDAVA